jgi:hypothetical protein
MYDLGESRSKAAEHKKLCCKKNPEDRWVYNKACFIEDLCLNFDTPIGDSAGLLYAIPLEIDELEVVPSDIPHRPNPQGVVTSKPSEDGVEEPASAAMRKVIAQRELPENITSETSDTKGRKKEGIDKKKNVANPLPPAKDKPPAPKKSQQEVRSKSQASTAPKKSAIKKAGSDGNGGTSDGYIPAGEDYIHQGVDGVAEMIITITTGTMRILVERLLPLRWLKAPLLERQLEN